MGNFSNVTLGGGAIAIDGIDIGFTEGDIAIKREVETKDMEAGIPLQTVGRVIIRENFTVEIPMAEVSIDNLSRASLNIPATTISGAPVSVLDAANQERTFAPPVVGALEQIVLDGPNVTGLVVEDQTETTTYTSGTDYLLDPGRGVVYRPPGSTIPSAATVRVSYTYTPPASKRLQIGQNLSITEKLVVITHISPVSGNIWTVRMYKAQAQGTLDISMKKEDFMIVNAQFKAIPDPSNPSSPLGYIDIQEV